MNTKTDPSRLARNSPWFKDFPHEILLASCRFLIKGKDQIRLDPQKPFSRPFGKFKSATNIGPLKLVVSRLIYSLRIPQKVFLINR